MSSSPPSGSFLEAELASAVFPAAAADDDAEARLPKLDDRTMLEPRGRPSAPLDWNLEG